MEGSEPLLPAASAERTAADSEPELVAEPNALEDPEVSEDPPASAEDPADELPPRLLPLDFFGFGSSAFGSITSTVAFIFGWIVQT